MSTNISYIHFYSTSNYYVSQDIHTYTSCTIYIHTQRRKQRVSAILLQHEVYILYIRGRGSGTIGIKRKVQKD